MTDTAIRVENLGKLYRIGAARQRHDTLRDALSSAFKRSHGPTLERSNATFWALRDVSFEVKRGEVVGVIGRNGAGKSTLLKILSRITEPTTGRVELHGRVGSLLEVGTGFHPELTGRENIYLNGAILGMKKAEIARRFDEIVAFAEIERFLDTPVKRYSSGMYVRLAFAVAAHLEPEILLVDEVLAVGDAAFQKKCLGKMGEVAGEGRTVLFVSHNMAAVQALCPRCVYMREGRHAFDGASTEAVDVYMQESRVSRHDDVSLFPMLSECGNLEVVSARATREQSHLVLRVEINAFRRMPVLGLGFEIRNTRDEIVTSQGATHSGAYVFDLEGRKALELEIRDVFSLLTGGEYRLGFWLARPSGQKYVEVPHAFAFTQESADLEKSGHPLTVIRNGPLFARTRFYVRDVEVPRHAHQV